MSVPQATVIPAQAGIHKLERLEGAAAVRLWIPAFAGMTMVGEAK